MQAEHPGGPFSTVLAAGESYHESQFKIGNVTMTGSRRRGERLSQLMMRNN